MPSKSKVKESRQVQKAREKLKKHLEVEHQQFTTDALQEMARKIRFALFRHNPELIVFEKTQVYTV